MLYIIGLGLNKEGFTYEAANAIKNCRRIYLEVYTTELPYEKQEIEELIQKKVHIANRDLVESESGKSNQIIQEAKQQNVALLVYGSPLIATTHISLIQETKKQKIPVRIIYSASILDAVAETGLQSYKFGKTTSMPKWDKEKNFTPDSFIDIIKQNQSINAHTLILIDIGLSFKDALKQLEIAAKNKKLKLGKIIICERFGSKDSKTYYDNIKELKDKKISAPFCLIIPDKLHFVEQTILEGE